eukprot:TRINITY_DN11095_c0_g1_i1.p1 TRINITY_DN11095_c0_g1~~TRINITY_DN11095_c0_g1_i1.p1  ORF type:complete len:427 (-),score=161.79 TRINITY_DN11095_c0_g1_i1:452-1732(-)
MLESFEEETKKIRHNFGETKNLCDSAKNIVSSLKRKLSVASMKEKGEKEGLKLLKKELKKNKTLQNVIKKDREAVKEKIEMEIQSESNINNVRLKEIKLILSESNQNFDELFSSFKKYKNKKDLLINKKNSSEIHASSISEQIEKIKQEVNAKKEELDRLEESKIKLQKEITTLNQKYNNKPISLNSFLKASKVLDKELGFCKMIPQVVFSQRKYLTALNSVLSGVIKSTVLVKTRKDADDCVNYFSSNKIGVVRVEILGEHNKAPSTKNLPGLIPLFNTLSFVKSDTSTSQKISNLFEELTNKWYILSDENNHDPISYLRKYNVNIVSLEGETYKSDGEIRSRKGGSSSDESFLISEKPILVDLQDDTLDDRKDTHYILQEKQNRIQQMMFEINELKDSINSFHNNKDSSTSALYTPTLDYAIPI